jgi:hypothetical protein
MAPTPVPTPPPTRLRRRTRRCVTYRVLALIRPVGTKANRSCRLGALGWSENAPPAMMTTALRRRTHAPTRSASTPSAPMCSPVGLGHVADHGRVIPTRRREPQLAGGSVRGVNTFCGPLGTCEPREADWFRRRLRRRYGTGTNDGQV